MEICAVPNTNTKLILIEYLFQIKANAKEECNGHHKKPILNFQNVSFDFVFYCTQNEESCYKINRLL